MRRKSERNKTKGSPAAEKKVEKPPTRRTTRRRGHKPSPSPSPERENPEDNTSSTPYSEDDRESAAAAAATDKQSKDTEEQQEKPVSSSDLIKSVLGGDEEDSGSVWKVARADASPGEIQKLKLCRQRNISEASDSSISKKKSNKWPDSGEGGVEEVDSVDEQIASSQNLPICENIDDPSSSHPGQDSNQEVSDYKENLPETTSANLSDDQTNIDQQADFKDNLLPETTSAETLSQPPNYEDNQSLDCLPIVDNSNSIRTTDEDAECAPENLPIIQQTGDFQEMFSNDQACFPSNAMPFQPPTADNNVSESNEKLTNITSGEGNAEIHEESMVEENKTDTANLESESVVVDEESVDTNKLDGNEKETNSDNISDSKEKSNIQDNKVVCRSPTRKNQSKYHESSASESSDDEQKSISRNDEAREKNESSSPVQQQTMDNKRNNENQTVQSTDVDENSTMSTNMEPEIELSESIIEKDDILEINEKSDDLNVTLSVSKPAKVSLKRSFSTRLSTDSAAAAAEKKTEESNTRQLSSTEDNQNKENHADNESKPDRKNSTKRRRWGVTTSTDVEPAFSISTDSLKALVPGAKPLSVNEVRLGKDEDEDKDRYKDKGEDDDGGHNKSKNDSLSRNDTNRKGDDKMDNHIVSRRKISIKETPRPTSPSPPAEPQATKILLIKNLVRPFTLNQIKELLSRTGSIAENGFWMDRIKSKCFVEYANEDQAFETRQALHGVSWPPSNPKKLVVEYAAKEDMEVARESSKDQSVVRKAAEPMLSAADSWQHQDQWSSREDRSTVVNKITVIREWDLGKEDGQLSSVKEKERERKDVEKKKRQRSRSPLLEAHHLLPAPARKFKKKEEEPPTAKLLDDLFRKTRATPCIYWLPLTNEQIMVKEEMRRQHMAEHARRLEEMRRAERSRDSRRRRSPRK